MILDQILADLRAKNPLVHCITNYVAMNISANVVLASGASPAMIHTPEEAADFAKIVGGLTVNIGTISPAWFEGMKLAAIAANEAAVPWVLDPVAHFATPYRSRAAQELLALKPTILRGNASEIMGLGGQASEAKGVDAKDSVESAEIGAMKLAKAHNMVVAVTGETDFVTDGSRTARIFGGSPVMPLVTAMGCSLTCLMGAFAAVSPPLEAAASALSLFAEAGNAAAAKANGPGSFQPLFLDALHATTPEMLSQSERIVWQ
jgi:hydroxyethylthiazole kinase